MDIATQIARARGGDLIAEIRPVQVKSVSEAAVLFSLHPSEDIYHEVSREEAERVLAAVLARDMAYGSPIVVPEEAALLARRFVEEFVSENPAFYTNGEWGRPTTRPGVGPGWTPATNHTFDTGVLVVTSRRTACAWFMDED